MEVCLARRLLSPDSGIAEILSSLTQSPGEQSSLFHVVVKQLSTDSRSVVSEPQYAPELYFTFPGSSNLPQGQKHCQQLKEVPNPLP